MGRRERRRQQLLDDLKETKRFWKLNEKALDSTLWGYSLRRGYEPSQDTLRDDEGNTSLHLT